jgi:hypothetical protein
MLEVDVKSVLWAGIISMDKFSNRLARTRSVCSIALLLLAGCALAVCSSGCSRGPAVAPALTLKDPQEIEKATKRGISIITNGSDPYIVFGKTTKEVNQSIGQGVIVRTAAICLPKEELAFQVAVAGDPSEVGAKRVAEAALRQINRQIRFTVVLQVLKSFNPEEVEFELLASGLAKSYPPVAVDPPEFVADVSSALDPDIPPMAVYGYNAYFPTVGSPGFPAIDITVVKLTLVIKAGGASTEVPFNIPSAALQ